MYNKCMTLLHDNRDRIPDAAKGCVLVIGNLDGIHLGHRALIEKARALAAERQAPLGVLTFEPHPRQFFQPGGDPFRLTLLPMKQRLLAELKVDHLFAFAFNREFSILSGDAFIDRVLVQSLKARHVVVGEDFSFGRERSGTAATLKAAAAVGKFGLSLVPQVVSPAGQVYSSSAVRELLRQGKFAEASALLGWPWQMEAPVVHGDKRGRTLGYPTANQDMAEYLRIPYGVYAVKALIEGETLWRGGAANFGIRPMFKSATPIFETFIFDFAEEIYGKILRVQPLRHLRPELSFAGLPELIAQMKDDCIKAKAVLESPP
jgi:riboflavin kinase/FMN adenylyltransferase